MPVAVAHPAIRIPSAKRHKVDLHKESKKHSPNTGTPCPPGPNILIDIDSVQIWFSCAC
jgi:hypothetical protein